MTNPIRIVLVEPSHPGNIGASARAMKNMGLDELCLVRPRLFPHSDATARASGADDILHRARVVDDLESALSDCGFVVGASARKRSLPWPALSTRDSAAKLAAMRTVCPVALVFGREKSGLTNDELKRCNALTTIPASPGYTSLNLAMAVQILAYELWMATEEIADEENPPDAPPALASELELFFEHLQRILLETGFLNPDNPRHLMLRLRRLFLRAHLDKNEINILRGILAAVEPSNLTNRRKQNTGRKSD
jgi:tRNA (cytidine32/uridine32-2'-O)-methyltransferase